MARAGSPKCSGRFFKRRARCSDIIDEENGATRKSDGFWRYKTVANVRSPRRRVSQFALGFSKAPADEQVLRERKVEMFGKRSSKERGLIEPAGSFSLARQGDRHDHAWFVRPQNALRVFNEQGYEGLDRISPTAEFQITDERTHGRGAIVSRRSEEIRMIRMTERSAIGAAS